MPAARGRARVYRGKRHAKHERKIKKDVVYKNKKSSLKCGAYSLYISRTQRKSRSSTNVSAGSEARARRAERERRAMGCIVVPFQAARARFLSTPQVVAWNCKTFCAARGLHRAGGETRVKRRLCTNYICINTSPPLSCLCQRALVSLGLSDYKHTRGQEQGVRIRLF